MSTLADRILEARTDAKLDPAELARLVGVKPAAAYQWESGATKSLKDVTLMTLSEVLGVSPLWLATGRGPKNLLDSVSQAVQRFETREGYRRFQVMGEGGAGPGIMNADYPEVVRELEIAEWRLQEELGRVPSPNRVKLLTVRGHSMAPRIREGDIVFVDVEDKVPTDGGIFVLVVHGYALVKRLEIRRDGYHVVSLATPDRPDIYPADRPDELGIAGRVLGAMQLRKAEDL
jgi:phage repressor protein C with HTH and peptisase S24 domain